MYNTTLANKNKLAVNSYLIKDILEATPAQLLIKVYDYAIMNCQKREMVKTNNALQELINALRFDEEEAKEISIGLLKLYKFCQEEMRKRNYGIVHKILVELREAWINALNLQKG